MILIVPWAIKGFLATVVGIIALVAVGAAYYQVKLLWRRGGWTRDAFIAEFGALGVTGSVAGTVYDYYRRHSLSRSYRVAPDDSLKGVYGAGDEEADKAAETITRELGFLLPDESILRQWPRPLTTVRDMVLWVDWIRNHQQLKS